jgi:proteic killer suppression protein
VTFLARSPEDGCHRVLRARARRARSGDLRALPGNRLEALGGDGRGQHSVRINDQYRISFVWKDGDAQRVEVVDYH